MAHLIQVFFFVQRLLLSASKDAYRSNPSCVWVIIMREVWAPLYFIRKREGVQH